MQAPVRMLGVALSACAPCCLAADDPAVCSFAVSELYGWKFCDLSWYSDVGQGYVVEESDNIAADWTQSTGSCVADGFITSTSLYSESSNHFYRVRKVDLEGPEISFLSPRRDDMAVPLDSKMQLKVEDPSGVAADSFVFFIDGVAVPDDCLKWDGSILTYEPKCGTLGANGQHLIVQVHAADRNGNRAVSDVSTVVLERPLRVIAQSVMYVGDDVFGPTYVETGGLAQQKPDIHLRELSDGKMTFTGGRAEDFTEGQYYLSLVPTNIFCRKCVSVDQLASGDVCVCTVSAAYSEIFSGNFSTDRAECSVYDGDGTPLVVKDAQSTKSIAPLTVSTRKVEVDSGLQSMDKYFNFSGGITKAFGGDFGVGRTLGVDMSLRLLGAFSLCGNFEQLDRSSDDISLFIQGEMIFNLDTTLSYSVALGSYEKTKSIPVNKLVFGVGPGLWIEYALDLDITLETDFSVVGDISTGAELAAGFCFHRSKKGGDWQSYPDNWFDCHVTGKPVSLNAGGEVSMGLTAALKMTAFFESLMGPYVSAGPYLEGSVKRVGSLNSQDVVLKRSAVAGLRCESGVDVRFVDEKSIGVRPIRKDCFISLFSDEHVLSRPEISQLPESLSVATGDQVSLSPVVTGQKSCRWTKDGSDINRHGTELRFQMTPSTAGTYTLYAENENGTTSASVVIELSSWQEDWQASDFAGTWFCTYSGTVALYDEYVFVRDIPYVKTEYIHLYPAGGGYVKSKVKYEGEDESDWRTESFSEYRLSSWVENGETVTYIQFCNADYQGVSGAFRVLSKDSGLLGMQGSWFPVQKCR